ncbi:MAG: hypothetical protein MR051_08245 [Lentisphaeria bacterium]|nr:hypothetical protein [Lentisphaeria bacterium]
MLLRVLSYFIPLSVNMLTGGVMFICSYRFAQAGCSGLVVGGAVAVWGIVYCLTNFAIRRVVRTETALSWLRAAAGCMVATSAGFLVFPGLYTQFLLIGLSGLGAGLFCMPFQLFAKSVESGKTPGAAKAAAFYTFSWSVGFAAGALFFARFVRVGFGINLGLSLAMMLAVFLIARLKRVAPAAATDLPAAPPETVSPEEEARRTFFAYSGWLIGGVGTLAVCMIRAMWPHHGEGLGISQTHIALTTALVSLVQALTALLLYRSSRWMFQRMPVLAFSLAGSSGLLIFALARMTALFYWAAVIYGVYSGCIYFYFVYHSLAHPVRAGYFVSGNEVIVGVISMVSPLAGGALADGFTSRAPFVFAAGVILLAWLIQWTAVTRRGTELEGAS